MSGKITESFLELLKSGLWQTEPDYNLLNGFTEKEWRLLWLSARKQTVQGLVYYGVNLLPQNCLPPIMTLASWMVEIERISQDNSRNNAVIDEVSSWWNEASINAVIMKGQTVAEFYPDPSIRLSGDIDLYFPSSSDWKESLKIAKSHGCDVGYDSDGDAHYLYKRIVLEHHQSSSELSSSRNVQRLKSLEVMEPWRNINKLSPLSNLLLLNTHLLKHAMVAGIGLRQFCDIAMAYKFYFGSESNSALSIQYAKEIDQLGISKWTSLLHSFLVTHLGMPEQYLPFPLKDSYDTSWLLSEVLKDGNFGEQQSSGDSMTKKIFSKLLFSLKYAPREYVARMSSLVAGRLKLIFRRTV